MKDMTRQLRRFKKEKSKKKAEKFLKIVMEDEYITDAMIGLYARTPRPC